MMTGNEYQKLAMRTNDGKATERLLDEMLVCKADWLKEMKLICDGSSRINVGGLFNGILGLTGESGEVSDLVKKGIFHEKGIDKDHLKKELGDVMWYIAMICDSVGFDLDDVMKTNIDKLIARYPDGFDTYKANHRSENDV